MSIFKRPLKSHKHLTFQKHPQKYSAQYSFSDSVLRSHECFLHDNFISGWNSKQLRCGDDFGREDVRIFRCYHALRGCYKYIWMCYSDTNWSYQVASLAIFSCAFIVIYRICYASAQEGHLPESFSYLHFRKSIPTLAVLLQVNQNEEGVGLNKTNNF